MIDARVPELSAPMAVFLWLAVAVVAAVMVPGFELAALIREERERRRLRSVWAEPPPPPEPAAAEPPAATG